MTKLTRWCNVSSTHSISVNVRPRSTLTCYALSLCPVKIFCIEYNEPVRPRQEGLQCDGRGSSGIEHVILQFLKMLTEKLFDQEKAMTGVASFPPLTSRKTLFPSPPETTRMEDVPEGK